MLQWKIVSRVIIIMTLFLLMGCTDEQIPDPTYPTQPIHYKLYDMSIINQESEWHINNTHDPSIIKVEEWYYVFSTDVKSAGELRPGIMVRKSKDLIEWEWVGYAFDNGIPAAALSWTNATNLWAPDIEKIGDLYYLYYSVSEFGTNQSYIGVATSASIEGPWNDQGEVIKSTKGDEPNAIDPNIIVDDNGDYWMSYGSFFGGIYVVRLDPSNGKLKAPGFGQKIASRDHLSEQGALEGPYIIYKPDLKMYYLFVSYDSLFADYNVRVGRANAITGPYLDYNGNNMNDTTYRPQYEIGNKILGGYKFLAGEGWTAPGHNSVLQDSDGQDYIIHHARGETKTAWSYLHVRKIIWTSDGWPVVSPERYAGETIQAIPKRMISGSWETIIQSKETNGKVRSKIIQLLPNGEVNDNKNVGKWKFDGDHTLEITWQDHKGKASSVEIIQFIPSWDWELNKPTLVYTGMNNLGEVIWGKQIKSVDGSDEMLSYTNPLIEQRADPWVFKHTDGYYYFTGSVPEYDRIELRRAKTIEGLRDAVEVNVWNKRDSGEMSKHIWAPEIHYIDGKWYIYYAAARTDAPFDHRTYVLENDSANPLEGTWVEKGKLKMNWESFTLDATSFEHDDVRFLVWAQRDPRIDGNSNLYIAELENPWTIKGKQVMLTKPELPWEVIGFKVNEGAAVLKKNGKIFMTYSASATDHNYSMGLLTAQDNSNLLDPSAWSKSENPVFVSNDENRIYGPGHNSFTISEDGAKDILMYHARSYKKITGDPLFDPNRHARAQVIQWNEDGTPNFGVPAADSVSKLR